MMTPTLQRQTRFAMQIADDVRLVDVATARAVTGDTAEEIAERYEDKTAGAHEATDHLTAFDLSLEQNGRREPRIWAGCLRSSTDANNWTLDSIIADCLLTNVIGLENKTFHLNSSQLERAWCISNQTILQLIKRKLVIGLRVGRNWKVNRASAASFLKGRLL